MDGEEGDEVRQVGVDRAGLGEQAGEAARGVVLQVEQAHGVPELLLAEAGVVGGGDQVRLGHLRAEVLALDGRGEQQVDEVAEADGGGGAQAGAVGEEGVGGAGGLLDGEREQRGDQLPVQVESGVRGGDGEGLAVLLGAEERPGLQEAGLELGVAPDAVLDDVDEFGGAPLVLRRLRVGGGLGLVARLADVGEDRVLVAVAVGHVVERLGDHVGDRPEPVDGADVAPGGLQGPAEGLGVLHGPVAGLLGGELGVGEAAPVDEDLQLHLGGDLGAGDVRVEGADEDVDRFVGGAEVDPAPYPGTSSTSLKS